MHARTVRSLLQEARAPGRGSATLPEAQMLLAHALGCRREDLIAWPERTVPSGAACAYAALVERRAAGEPIAYLTGRREFWSMTLEVDPGTLIPRPESELLVELALEKLAPGRPAAVADLGTGTGALAIAIARERPRARVIATDLCPRALAVAARNVARWAPGRVTLRRGAWCAALANARLDLILSNPPYVADDDPHLRRGDVAFEPRLALRGGPDGLVPIRAIARGARTCLRPGGWLLLEHGCGQADGVRKILADDGYRDIASAPDLAGLPRATLARSAAPSPQRSAP